MLVRDEPLTNPLTSLAVLFSAWKCLLFGVAFLTPGLGYDTSTNLLFALSGASSNDRLDHDWWSSFSSAFLGRLVRWDAIYSVSIAHRGYQVEQEWFFGWGMTRLISFFAKMTNGGGAGLSAHAWAAILISTLSHLLSVLVLYQLVLLFFERKGGSRVAFLAACLHIVAPAGLFLCAPYGESLFSLLNFAGSLAYRKSSPARLTYNSRNARHDLWLVLAGLLFGLATTIRSNGLLNGIVFAIDLAAAVLHLPRLFRSSAGLRYCSALIVGGTLIGLGFVGPQHLAYKQFCIDLPAGVARRSWCTAVPPIIYTFVQRKYWNLGFLRYWHPQHIPEFILAAPVYSLLVTSAATMMKQQTRYFNRQPSLQKLTEKSPVPKFADSSATQCLWRMALPQLALTLPALTNYHVQIVTRLASGYPLLYVWIATTIIEDRRIRFLSREFSLSRMILTWFIMYATIQGALFASFLPPA